MSTRNAPGTIALVAVPDASIAACRNRSLLFVIFKPYVISMTSAPTVLATGAENENYSEINMSFSKAHNSI